ncbi:MAG: methylated-DNA--[protein]-cysteine S-methyltransferase [Pseudomonadota bacterium]
MNASTPSSADNDYERIAKAIRWIDAHRHDQPTVASMAASVALSEAHFSRMFRRWAGISPQRYLAHVTLADARHALRCNATVEQAAFDSGLSGSSRLHDLFVRIDAVSPGEFRRGGEGVKLGWSFAETRFGDALLATSARGIVALRFGDVAAREARVAALHAEWPRAQWQQDDELVSVITALLDRSQDGPIHVLLRGTPFQHKVWEALLGIPDGQVVSYGTLARRIGMPSAARAVGSAVGANPVAILIPCHRVLRADGALGGYRWGEDRKRAVLAFEQCRQINASR